MQPKAFVCSLIVLCILAGPAVAQTTRPTTAPGTAPARSDKLSVTEHELTLDGQLLKYKATAGFMPVRDEAGKEKASFFFIAYEKLGDNPQKRPLTFVFNGGPGAASVWLHMGTAGPKRIVLRDDKGEAPAPPFTVADNEASWLDLTDLVFIDPIGTGYSRPAPGEKGDAFYGAKEDVSSVAEFIRLYTTQYERWLSPKYLAGESYGTTRAAALSEHLVDRLGIAVNGIMLISVVLDFQTIQASEGNDLPHTMFLPAYTATAWYHNRLAPDLQKDLPATLREAEAFALGDYAAALLQGDALPAGKRKEVVTQLARLTSLPAEHIDRANLRINPGDFRKMLLQADRRQLGRFDARITGYDLRPAAGWSEYDPSLSPYLAVYAAAFNDYVRRGLGFESTLDYAVLSDRVHPWNWGRQGSGGYHNVTPELRSAMAKMPYLRILFASGYFDLATPYMSARHTINRLNLSPELRRNITHTFYPGGHMMYHERESRMKLKQDIRAFMGGAVKD